MSSRKSNDDIENTAVGMSLLYGDESDELDYLRRVILHGTGLSQERDAEVRQAACHALVAVLADEEGRK